MKRICLLFILLISLVLVLSACGDRETTTTAQNLDTTEVKDTTAEEKVEESLNCTIELVRCGVYRDEAAPPEISIFTDVVDFDDNFEAKYITPYGIIDPKIAEYNITFFKTRGVAVIYMKTDATTDIPYLDSVTQNRDTDALTVTIGVSRESEILDTKEGWLVLVSFPKESGFFGKLDGTVEFLPITEAR